MLEWKDVFFLLVLILVLYLGGNHVSVKSGMISSVWKINVKPDDIVSVEAVLVVLESMKMEIAVRAPSLPTTKPGANGVMKCQKASGGKYQVVEVCKEIGDRVEVGEVLLVLREAVSQNTT